MHINIYDENIGGITPISIKTRVKHGATYYGVTIVFQGVHDQITFWATSKERLSRLFSGVAVLIDAGVCEGSLETPCVKEQVYAFCGTLNANGKSFAN